MAISFLDVKLGIRMLGRHPGLSIVGGIGIAVGVAISVAMFSVIGVMIYPELPLEEGHRIVALENRDQERNNEERRAVHDFVTWREELRSVEHLAAFRNVTRNLIASDATPERIVVAEMTAAGFRVPRVAPLVGRYFVEADEAPDSAPVIVIGHDVWQSRFEGDPAVIGRDLRLGSKLHTIVGVMPEGFRFPESHQYWTPFRPDPAGHARREGPAIFIFGRLAPGVTIEQAQAELETLGLRAATQFPESNAQLRPMVMPYTHSLTDVQGITLWEVSQMQVLMTLILVVIALNVALLVYARTAMRERELAIRCAIGASRPRIVAQLFAEAFVLSLIATGAGLALAQVGISLANRIVSREVGPNQPFWFDWSLQPTTMLFTAGLALFTAVIVGVIPGLQATRQLRMRLSEVSGGTDLRLGKVWTILIVGQIALAVALLPAAVNMAWSAVREAATRPAYAAGEYYSAYLAKDPDLADEASGEFGAELAEIMRLLESEPGVSGVAFEGSPPDESDSVEVDGLPGQHRVRAMGVDPSLFDLYGVRILAGRPFERGDLSPEPRAVIVNAAFGERYLQSETPLGRTIRYAPETPSSESEPRVSYQIVGVVENLELNRADPGLVMPAIYHPIAIEGVSGARVVLRVEPGAAEPLGGRFREIAAAVNPLVRVGELGSLLQRNEQERIVARLVGLAVALILTSVMLLSAAGVYALMSFTVTRRRREIGIRSTLGAQPRDLLRDVFGRAASQVVLGAALGAAIAILLELASDGALMGGHGSIILPPIAIGMGIVGLLAAIGPARRGLKIQPTEALRAEG